MGYDRSRGQGGYEHDATMDQPVWGAGFRYGLNSVGSAGVVCWCLRRDNWRPRWRIAAGLVLPRNKCRAVGHVVPERDYSLLITDRLAAWPRGR